ncbi:hypothetical protein ACQE3D_10700 [Methylomonas sp. MS20]|uniref:hypothetical protein n=1 Tax=unclassified Methylomonas TaxID=2608980 RepID=UPI0028A51BA7|nr:hypothetical protein [Methylomonas sp. MV1]MDT4328534.1 hypothetical protein [Methylomonas sp. MV1]
MAPAEGGPTQKNIRSGPGAPYLPSAQPPAWPHETGPVILGLRCNAGRFSPAIENAMTQNQDLKIISKALGPDAGHWGLFNNKQELLAEVWRQTNGGWNWRVKDGECWQNGFEPSRIDALNAAYASCVKAGIIEPLP